MKVLVTGAGGFIGTHICNYFCEQGHAVFGWDRFARTNPGWELYQVDMSDEKIVYDTLQRERPDVIVHCAGSADVGKSVENPYADYMGNVTLTHHLLFAMHKAELTNCRMIFLSSAGVYGNPKELPIPETAELNPLSPYALHKVMCEEICKYFAKNYGLDVRIARIFSAYGKGLTKQIFWDMYNKALNTGKLKMFGTGSESRDYIHVTDVIRSLYLLATVSSDEVVFNVANGEETTIRQAAECFADCANIDKENIEFNGVVREGDPLNWCADISKMKSLGYEKSVDMKAGLDEYCEWARRMK